MADSKKVYCSYESVHRAVHAMAPTIKAEFKPDVIVGIGTGGYIPARMLRAHIRVPFLAVGLRLYNDATDTQEEHIVKTQWFDDNCDPWKLLHGRNVLIVDEIDDSRRTLQYCAEKIMEEYTPARVGIMVVHNKLKEKHGSLPEGVAYFCSQDIPGDTWLVYPWESCDIDAHNTHCLDQEQ